MKIKSVLSDLQILEEIKNGNVIYHSPNNIPITCGNCSVDVTLGSYYYTQNPSVKIINPWNPESVRKLWGSPKEALRVKDVISSNLENSSALNTELSKLNSDDRIIILKPGENILAHTNEFIGGRNNITTMMKARSSVGRNFISVCNDAGWGDVGYINRWTMEISNSNNFPVILVVGERIAQIVFYYTGTVKNNYSGSYQNSSDFEKLVASWSPDLLLPRLNRN